MRKKTEKSTALEGSGDMKIMDYMKRYDYEELVFCCDTGVGLNAIIAIHDTTLGPALGGARMWPYQSEEAAILDALRLARAMTYKSSAAGLNLGGGKTVIIGDTAQDKSTGLFRSLGRFIESLNGRYIATEDLGTSISDMQHIRAETTYVTGLPLAWGSSGDPSPMTSFGIYHGMKACAKAIFGSDSLQGRTVAIQGFGKVGSHLARHLRYEGAHMLVADIDKGALGGIINGQTISRLKCRIVAGGANNQLGEEKHGDSLQQKGILYAPDFIINAGGVINISVELTGYNVDLARTQVAEIYHTVEKVIALAKSERISTARAADKLATDRIEEVRKVRRIYLKK